MVCCSRTELLQDGQSPVTFLFHPETQIAIQNPAQLGVAVKSDGI